MADQAWLQYFEAPLSYSIENKNSGINLQYDRLVNYVPTKLPTEYFWYQWEHSIWPEETGDRPEFAMRKRNWMLKVMEEDWFYITDNVLINGQLHVMWKSNDNTQMKIVKYETEYHDWCENLFDDNSKWNKLCEIMDGINPCSPDYLLKIRAPYGKVDVTKTHKAKLIHTIVGNTVVATVVTMDWTPINAAVWNVIYVFGADEANVITWYYRQVTGLFNQQTQIFWKRLGLNDYTPTTTVNSDGSTSTTRSWDPWAIATEINVFIKVYPGVAETIAYVSNVWIRYLSNFDCAHNQIEEIPQTQTKHPITGFANWNEDGIAFVSNWYANFTNGWENLGIISYSIPVGSWYTDLLPIQQYMMLLGPQSMGLIYQSALDRFGIPIPRMFDVKTDIGYFNKGSYQRYFYDGTEDFIIFQSDGNLMRYVIEPYDNGLWWIYFRLNGTPIGNRFIDSDLSVLKRKKWDKVYIYRNKNWFTLFLTDHRWWELTGTKVIFFSDKYKFYYRWYLCWLQIRWEKYGLWFGNKWYVNQWSADDWEQFKTIVNGRFGNLTYMSGKIFDSILLLIWSESVITPKNTKLILRNHTGWFVVEQILDDLTRPQYISMINKENRSWKDDKLLASIPGAIGVYWSLPAVNIIKKYADLTNDIQALCSYDPEAPERGWVCDEKHLYKKLFIAKIWVIREKLSREWEQLDFELVTEGADSIVYCWLRIAYNFTDAELRNPNNVIWIAWLTDKSYPTKK